MLDLPLCLGVLKHRAPLDFYLCDAILNLKAFYFWAIPDIMIELIVYVCDAILNLKAFYFWAIPDIMIELIVYVCDAILNLKAFCFWAIPDIMIELIVYVSCHKQVVMTVAQWHRNQINRGLLVIGKNMFKMDSCLRDTILIFTVFC